MMKEIKQLETSKSNAINSGELPEDADLAMSNDGLESKVMLAERVEILDKYLNNGQNPHIIAS